MKTRHLWNGVRMRTLEAAADPDSPFYSVTLPINWEDEAAAALLQLCHKQQLGAPSVRLDEIAMEWLVPLCKKSKTFAIEEWIDLLLFRQAAPGISIWKNDEFQKPSIALNLAAFASPESGFDAKAYHRALQIIADSLRLIAKNSSQYCNGEFAFLTEESKKTHSEKEKQSEDKDLFSESSPIAGTILLSNLDACLAQLGLDYDSNQGRNVACCLVAFANLLACIGCGAQYLPLSPDWNNLPELAPLAKELWALASAETDHPLHRIETGFSSPGPIDALLDIEACGLSPIFSPLRSDGRLAFSTLARLAAKGLTLETAFAAALAGEQVISQPNILAHHAMYQALAGFVTHMPARPNPITLPLSQKAILPRGVRRPLPARHNGITQKVNIGGHGLFLRTGEYEEGSLGEVSLTPAKENAMVRGLLDSLGQAVSIGLQYGASLEDYVSVFAYSRFGAAGTVEGDPSVSYATSFLDYSFRMLSDVYLHHSLSDAPNNLGSNLNDFPMLPLDLPTEEEDHIVLTKNRRLKIVKS